MDVITFLFIYFLCQSPKKFIMNKFYRTRLSHAIVFYTKFQAARKKLQQEQELSFPR